MGISSKCAAVAGNYQATWSLCFCYTARALRPAAFPDGREEPSTLTTGETAYRPGTTHIGQNLGDTNLWVIAVEPK